MEKLLLKLSSFYAFSKNIYFVFAKKGNKIREPYVINKIPIDLKICAAIKVFKKRKKSEMKQFRKKLIDLICIYDNKLSMIIM